jgi:hypothetical protein
MAKNTYRVHKKGLKKTKNTNIRVDNAEKGDIM